MKHAWLWVLVGSVGCGTNDGPAGEPQNGSAMVTFGSRTEMLDVGAAILNTSDTTKMFVQLGNDHVNCSMDLVNGQAFPPKGSYMYFEFDKMTPGTDTMANFGTVDFTGNNLTIDLAQGMATVATIDTRVTGNFTFTTTDDKLGTITASGTFDVKKCF